MPRATRSRTIAASPETLEAILSDPYHLPRWWPRAQRVESFGEGQGGDAWTLVLETDRGKSVRADFRRLEVTEPGRFAWEQLVEGTPFARILRWAKTEIGLEPEPSGTVVTISITQRLRGLARLGSPMVRRATRVQLDEALDGLERIAA